MSTTFYESPEHSPRFQISIDATHGCAYFHQHTDVNGQEAGERCVVVPREELLPIARNIERFCSDEVARAGEGLEYGLHQCEDTESLWLELPAIGTRDELVAMDLEAVALRLHGIFELATKLFSRYLHDEREKRDAAEQLARESGQ